MTAKEQLLLIVQGKRIELQKLEFSICLLDNNGGATMRTQGKEEYLDAEQLAAYRAKFGGITIDLADDEKGSS